MANERVKSSSGRDDFWRMAAMSAASVATVIGFYTPGYGLAAICFILTLCLGALNEIWQRAEGIRFMMELKLDREGAFGE